jgi:hypothetical protein
MGDEFPVLLRCPGPLLGPGPVLNIQSLFWRERWRSHTATLPISWSPPINSQFGPRVDHVICEKLPSLTLMIGRLFELTPTVVDYQNRGLSDPRYQNRPNGPTPLLGTLGIDL